MNRIARCSSAYKAIGASALVASVAAFLPWVSVFGVSLYGIEGDGVVTLLFGAVGLVVFASHLGFGPLSIGPRAFFSTQAVCSVIVFAVGAYDMNRFAAFGLYLTLAAGIAWLGAVAVAWRASRQRSVRVATS